MDDAQKCEVGSSGKRIRNELIKMKQKSFRF